MKSKTRKLSPPTRVSAARSRLNPRHGSLSELVRCRRHEVEMERWNEQLERHVAERTAQLEAANQELEAFSYSVSHDLRAPLRHIDGFVEILRSRDSRLDAEDRVLLQRIADAARQMGELIDNLLSFSRASRAQLHPRRVDLKALVKETVNRARSGLKQRRVKWVIRRLPDVDADLNMLRQVLINLIDNALKYSSTRKMARVEIGGTTAGDEIVVFVRDNGVGFEMQYANKLFGVFQRLHLASQFEGTGLGLANVRRIIHRHGGRTWAEGEPDRGATFYFSLPKPSKNTP